MQSSTKERSDAELAERERALRGASAASATSVSGNAAAPSGAPIDLSSLIERPDVQAVIAAAVAEATAGIMARIEAQRGDSAPVSTDRQFAEHIALSIASLVDQGRPGSRRTVAPAILALRDKARVEMFDAIIAARANHTVGEWELIAPVYLSETWIANTYVGQDKVRRARHVRWPGVPNEAMRPLNDTARLIYRHFCESIGSSSIPLKPSDPLVEGFEILGPSGPGAEIGTGMGYQADGAVQLREFQPDGVLDGPLHILGTIAEPAKPIVYNG